MPIADFEKQVDQTAQNIQDSPDISAENSDAILEYRRDMALKGLSQATVARNLSRLKIVAEHIEMPFEDMDTDDVKDLVAWIQGRDYTEETVDTYKTVIKAFFGWLREADSDETPPEVQWITLSNGNGEGKLPTDLLTKEDIQAQIEAAYNPRDKAFIAMLYETGARIGELIDLTVGDIEDRRHGKKVVIDGKTGQRRLPLVECVPHLNTWLSKHPNPTKDAPLWCKVQQGGPDDQLGYRYIREKILAKTMDKAGIDKPSNPHHYRHSRASYLANHMTESQLCQWFGWVQGSDVPAKYVHLSGRDMDNAYDQLHGLTEPEDEETPDVIQCPRCEELNDPQAAYCMRCGLAFKEATADLEAEIDQDVKEDYRDSPPGDRETHALVDAFEQALEDHPELKEAVFQHYDGD